MMLHDTNWASPVTKMDRRKGDEEEKEGQDTEGDTQSSNSFSSLFTK